ncbi:MAG: hypothetical protein CMN79_04410 [Spirochaetales bacterium]|nr:hypothetical protein [Spirochaetales bacterium]|tara:strand:- start:2288 stop:2923 length:636 start_codon:yes stop_codon:yes gene_type:complete
MKNKENIIIFGCGGHAKSVANILFETKKYKIIAFVGKDIKTKKLLGIETLEEAKFFNKKLKYQNFVIGIGNITQREKCYKKIKKHFPKAIFPTINHPNTSISENVKIGIGTVIMSNVVVNISSEIGKFCILNTSSTIDHDCKLEDYVSIAPNVSIAGSCTIGRRSFIGVGSSIIHNIQIGKSVVVGAGSCVVKNLLIKNTYAGSPAKKINN